MARMPHCITLKQIFINKCPNTTHVRGIPRETFEAHVEDVIRGIADDIAREHVAEGDDDWQARRAALAAGIGRRAALSAKTYVKWRTDNE